MTTQKQQSINLDNNLKHISYLALSGRLKKDTPMNSEDSYLARHAIVSAAAQQELTEFERRRPFYLLKPKVFPDGNKWCALYGENIMAGVAGFGSTPAEAATMFDIQWLNENAPFNNLSRQD